jgi:hypothetical protein
VAWDAGASCAPAPQPCESMIPRRPPGGTNRARGRSPRAAGEPLPRARGRGFSKRAPCGARLDEPMPRVGRVWWQCRCGRRCRYIYVPELRCQKCLGLQHACLHLHRQVPWPRLIARLRRRLDPTCDPRPFAPLPPRMRGRSQARHDELVAAIRDEEAKLVELGQLLAFACAQSRCWHSGVLCSRRVPSP